MAFTRTSPEADAALQASFPRPLSRFPGASGSAGAKSSTSRMLKVELAEFPALLEVARLRGFRSMLFVPLLREGTVIGIISVTRVAPGRFADHHVQLLQTFADQAVIAIGNVRLFDEVQAKTRDLSEALTFQTGSSKILSVIASSPTDVGPVLQAIVESACELCEAYDAIIALKDGDELALRAHHGPIAMTGERWPNHRTSLSGRAIADARQCTFATSYPMKARNFQSKQMSRVRWRSQHVQRVPDDPRGRAIGDDLRCCASQIHSATNKSRCCRHSPTRR